MPETTTQLGESRDSFMARVRSALQHETTAAPTEQAPAVDETLARLASADDDLLAMFAERATGVGMVVHQITQAQMLDKLANVLDETGSKSVAVAAGAVGRDMGVEEALRAGNLRVLDWQNASFDAQYELDAGVTDVHAALAETGTLICCSGAAHSRGLSLVVPIHIAIVRQSDILPDMIDYWARLKGIPNTELPSSTAFITGPSKTADIEGELITGVHGPEAVHILLIEDA